MIILEHPTSGVVLKLFRPAKNKIHQDWTIVCWHNEAGDQKERKDYSLEMYGACDYLDVLPQSMANSSSTMLHSWPFMH